MRSNSGIRGGRPDWDRFRSMTGEQIRSAIEKDPDAPSTDAGFWKNAKLVLPRAKQTVTIRLDGCSS